MMGPEVTELEQQAGRVRRRSSIASASSSGTDTLLIALMALGIGPGDEVITSPFTFFATARNDRARPARSPCSSTSTPRTYNIDPALLEAAITPRTKAIMPVSLYGQCADIDAINAIARQPPPAGHRGRRAEFRRDVQGQALVRTDGDRLDVVLSVEAARVLRRRRRAVHERRRLAERDARDPRARPGSSISPSAARAHRAPRHDPGGRAARQARNLRRGGRGPRAASAQRYTELIAISSAPARRRKVHAPEVAPYCTSVFAQYTVEVEQRDIVETAHEAAGVPTAVHYPVSLHMQPVFERPRALGRATSRIPRPPPARDQPADASVPHRRAAAQVVNALAQASLSEVTVRDSDVGTACQYAQWLPTSTNTALLTSPPCARSSSTPKPLASSRSRATAIIEIGASRSSIDAGPGGSFIATCAPIERSTAARSRCTASRRIPAQQPRFADVVEELLEFVAGAELIIHNAAFDVAFLDAELEAPARARSAS